MRRVPALILTSTLTGTLALGLAACGGSSNKSGSGAGGSDTTTTSGGGSGGSGNEISDLVKKAKSANVKVTYKTTGSDTTFQLAQYNGDSAMTTGDSTIITTGGKTYSCSGTGSDAKCSELPGGATLGNTLLSSFFGAYSLLFSAPDTLTGKLGFVNKSESTETIAGRNAKCATISAGVFTGVTGQLELCVDSETGILLKGQTTSGGKTSSIEATEFATSTADDVKLPATPTQITLPTIPGVSIPTVPTSY
jgi:hypothetical protein